MIPDMAKKSNSGTKKADPALVKLLKKQEALVADLTGQLKKQAKKLKKASAEREELLAKVDKHKAKAKAAKRKYQSIKDHEDRTVLTAVPNVGPDTPVEDDAAPTVGPDTTWTVTRLRAEARSRGVSGYSRLTKAQLLDALA